MHHPTVPFCAIEVFAEPGCDDCRRAMALLDRKRLPYRKISLSDSVAREELRRRLPSPWAAPHVFIGGRYVGGLEDLAILAEDGDLDGLACGELH